MKRKLHISLSLLLLLSIAAMSASAQSTNTRDTIRTAAIVYNGDTMPYGVLEWVYVYSKFNERNLSAAAKYDRLRNAVYVTYPYARRAGAIMNDINLKLVNVSDKQLRKTYIRSREAELKKEFTQPLSKLSVYQGKVLMKLINRETGNNCYEIIKEYRGGLTARMYQTVAFFFNSNLKQTYDATAQDAVVEKFVKEVQRMHGYTDLPQVRAM